MKKTNEIYYTVTDWQYSDDGDHWYESIRIFRTGWPLEDRKAAIDYIIQQKINRPYFSYKLCLRIQHAVDQEDILILIDFDRGVELDLCVHSEVSFYKYKKYSLKNETYNIGMYTFIKGSQVLNELTLNYQFEVATKSGDLTKLKELVNRNGIKIINELLTIAIYDGHFEIVKYCCENGADLTYKDNQPLKVAKLRKRVEIESFILKNITGQHPISNDL